MFILQDEIAAGVLAVHIESVRLDFSMLHGLCTAQHVAMAVSFHVLVAAIEGSAAQ